MAATRRLTTILSADVVGYSRLVGADEEGTLGRLLSHRREWIDPKIGEHGGRIVNTAGDGVLAEFPSVVDAVRCAAELQRGMLDREAEFPDDRQIKFRIGINLGDVVVEGSDLLGDGVNIAARLQELAEPGAIYVSRTVRDQIRDRLPYPLHDLGEQRVKNIARPVRVYAIDARAITTLPVPHRPTAAATTSPAKYRGVVFAVIATLLIGIPAVLIWYRHNWDRASSASPHRPAGADSGTVPAPRPRLSIVVLPFANLSDDPAQEYLADGITEDLTTDLSRIEDSFVIARNTAFTYKGKAVEVKQIGRDLGVRYVLEGSARRVGSQIRVNAQLVDAETGAHLWAERFDTGSNDLFNMESEITGRIARAVRARILAAEAARHTDHPGAFDFILRGRAALTKPVSRAASDETIGLFEQALALDPDAARAKIGLASALVSRVLDEFSPSPSVDLQRAEQLVGSAIEAMPNSGWAHYVKGQVLRAQNRCAEAIPEYESAIGLDRNSAPSYASLGWCRFLTGEPEKTIALEEQAIRLSPQDRALAAWQARIGMVHLLQGRTDEAVVWLEKARSGYADRPGGDPIYVHAWLASAYALKSDGEKARAELEEAWKRGFHRTMAGFGQDGWYGNPKTRALAEATYFVGLRKAGMPTE